VPFIEFDLTKDAFLPCDVWLCRACLFHLSFEDIVKVLKNFAKSTGRLALISNHHGVLKNADITTGDYRPLDLTLPPISLPPPRRLLTDKPHGENEITVGIWQREEIARSVE
jgi:hypothetical protein